MADLLSPHLLEDVNLTKYNSMVKKPIVEALELHVASTIIQLDIHVHHRINTHTYTFRR